ncbi:MAG: HRDC domain-containing protein [Actinomycetaceae bacterium]|nr:HRDC domain-containing protein [Actinomycetaceae bacterium]
MSDVPLITIDVPRGGVPPLIHDGIDWAVRTLASGHGPFAMDTERAMGIRYSNRAYLIQIRREGAGTFLIDPVGIEDRLETLAEVLHTDTWILHSAFQDLPCLRELGLEPPTIYDTEMAGLLLGFERVSLQAEIADVLGYDLAKEHSFSDWSARPLTSALLSYAALDVEFLVELSNELTARLEKAGRMEWFRQECEEIRLRKVKEPTEEAWRSAARSFKIRDRRALGMLESLWEERENIARERDIATGRVLPNKSLAQIASMKPRSLEDLQRSAVLRSRTGRRDAKRYWSAIAPVWSAPQEALPVRENNTNDDYMSPARWETLAPERAERWALVRPAVIARAEELGIRQDILLKPLIQKQLAWQGWKSINDIPEILANLGARPWQIENVVPAIVTALEYKS